MNAHAITSNELTGMFSGWLDQFQSAAKAAAPILRSFYQSEIVPPSSQRMPEFLEALAAKGRRIWNKIVLPLWEQRHEHDISEASLADIFVATGGVLTCLMGRNTVFKLNAWIKNTKLFGLIARTHAARRSTRVSCDSLEALIEKGKEPKSCSQGPEADFNKTESPLSAKTIERLNELIAWVRKDPKHALLLAQIIVLLGRQATSRSDFTLDASAAGLVTKQQLENIARQQRQHSKKMKTQNRSKNETTQLWRLRKMIKTVFGLAACILMLCSLEFAYRNIPNSSIPSPALGFPSSKLPASSLNLAGNSCGRSIDEERRIRV